MSRYQLYRALHDAILEPVSGGLGPYGGMLYIPGVGALLGYGTTAGNGTEGWAPGALYIDTDASGDARILYNSGTATTAVWTRRVNTTGTGTGSGSGSGTGSGSGSGTGTSP